MVITSAPGEEAQVDYGEGPMAQRTPTPASTGRTRLLRPDPRLLAQGSNRAAVPDSVERLDVAQAYLDRWERRWADTRIHGTTKRQVAVMFAEERPALGPLPLEPFRYYQYGRRTVHLDGCVEVAAAYYSAPPGWIGRRVDVQWNGAHVRLLDPRTGQLLREHLRAPRGWHRIADPDRPARTPPKTLALLAAAKRAGPAISAVCDHIHRHDGVAGVRRILGVRARRGWSRSPAAVPPLLAATPRQRPDRADASSSRHGGRCSTRRSSRLWVPGNGRGLIRRRAVLPSPTNSSKRS